MQRAATTVGAVDFLPFGMMVTADARGLRDTYTQAYARLVEAHDEFGYFKRRGIHAHFDSKENFDTNFQSNWYYYYK